MRKEKKRKSNKWTYRVYILTKCKEYKIVIRILKEPIHFIKEDREK